MSDYEDAHDQFAKPVDGSDRDAVEGGCEDAPVLHSGFQTSEELNELAAALGKAQGEIETPKLDGTNPHYHSKYVTLAGLWSAARAPLSKHELALIQAPTGEGLVTRLIHSSGQWVETTIKMPPGRPGPQALGSMLTYLRRYTFAAMVGLVGDTDDDGEAADGFDQSRLANPATPPNAAPKQTVARPADPLSESATKPVTQAQLKRLYAMIAENGLDRERVRKWAKEACSVDSLKELTQSQYQKLCDKLPELGEEALDDDIPF